MRKIIRFIVGAIIGIVLCFVLFYISGYVFEALGINLYESESEQQRNFNIFLVLSLVFALVGGYVLSKKNV